MGVSAPLSLWRNTVNNTSHPGFLIPYTLILMTVLDVLVTGIFMLVGYVVANDLNIAYISPILGKGLILGAGLMGIGIGTAVYWPFSNTREFIYLAIALNIIGSIMVGLVSGILLYKGI